MKAVTLFLPCHDPIYYDNIYGLSHSAKKNMDQVIFAVERFIVPRTMHVFSFLLVLKEYLGLGCRREKEKKREGVRHRKKFPYISYL